MKPYRDLTRLLHDIQWQDKASWAERVAQLVPETKVPEVDAILHRMALRHGIQWPLTVKTLRAARAFLLRGVLSNEHFEWRDSPLFIASLRSYARISSHGESRDEVCARCIRRCRGVRMLCAARTPSPRCFYLDRRGRHEQLQPSSHPDDRERRWVGMGRVGMGRDGADEGRRPPQASSSQLTPRAQVERAAVQAPCLYPKS